MANINQNQSQIQKKKDKVVFGIQMDKELKTRLKMYCAKNDLTITEAIEQAVREFLEKYDKD